MAAKTSPVAIHAIKVSMTRSIRVSPYSNTILVWALFFVPICTFLGSLQAREPRFRVTPDCQHNKSTIDLHFCPAIRQISSRSDGAYAYALVKT
jgi:hypothetical protein